MRLRADRTGGIHDELYLAAETDLGAVLGHIQAVRPQLLVVDSVQTIGAADVDGVPGGVTQVKEVAAALVRVAKTQNIATVLVGHVTKDGSIAGPRVLEHLVDVVLHFEGERSSRLRMVRAVKNRFGPVDEVGCFDLSGEGIVAVTDPTGLFVARHHEPVAGTCVSVVARGPPADPGRGAGAGDPGDRRAPPSYDVRARRLPDRDDRGRAPAAGPDPAAHPRRVRLDRRRGPDRRAGRRPGLGASRSRRRGSSATSPRDLVAIGEIGLAGELRRVRDIPQRLAEAARLGFRGAIVPAESHRDAGAVRTVDGMKVVSASRTSTPPCGCSTSGCTTARRCSRCTAPSRDAPRSASCDPSAPRPAGSP